MKYKKAQAPIEIKGDSPEKFIKELEEKGLLIKQWDLDFLKADLNWCGRNGSPTKVHRIQSVVLAAKESKDVEPTKKGVEDMTHELIKDKTIA
jgi:electron transfer flavoprotein beta subunit